MNDLERLEGRFYGDLDAYEKWLCDHAIQDGIVSKTYEGTAGFLGLSKIVLRREVAYPK